MVSFQNWSVDDRNLKIGIKYCQWWLISHLKWFWKFLPFWLKNSTFTIWKYMFLVQITKYVRFLSQQKLTGNYLSTPVGCPIQLTFTPYILWCEQVDAVLDHVCRQPSCYFDNFESVLITLEGWRQIEDSAYWDFQSLDVDGSKTLPLSCCLILAK